GGDRPKAFARLGDLPLLAEPLRRLDDCDSIDAIVVVAPAGWEEPAILLVEEIGASKVSACVPGGETRSASVRAGLAGVPAEAAGGRVKVVAGDERLLKVTTPADLERVAAWLRE